MPQAPINPQAQLISQAPGPVAPGPASATPGAQLQGVAPAQLQGPGALPTPGNEAAAQAQIMEGLRNITVGNEEEGSSMIQQGFALLSPESQAAFLENLPPEQAAIVTAKTTQEASGVPVEEFLFGAGQR